jgi:hypothetical protein
MKKTFSRRKSKNPVHKALLAFDVENDPKTGDFICAGLNGLRMNTRQHELPQNEYIDNQDGLLHYLDTAKRIEDKNIPFKLVAFNLAYDYWFINKICDDSRLLSVGGRIITGRLNNGIPMIDLTNHVDGTLEDWIGYLNMEEKWGVKKESLDDLQKRVMSDARATYELGHFLEDFYVHEMGITFKMTVASCARELYQQKFFKHYWTRDNPQIDELERQSYRGGRVEVFKRGERTINGYDVNSMYLSIMEEALIPDPNSAKITHTPQKLPEGLYITKVDVVVPKQHIGVLPLYHDEMNKLIFPVGSFTGVFCSPELDYAIKHCGVKIKKIYWSISYRGYPYFKEYAQFIWKKRQEYKAKNNRGMEIMIKKLGNALYGSFGQRNTIETFYGKLEDLGEIEEGASIKITTINGTEYTSMSSPEKEDSTHTFPCIPSFITSYARVKLLKGMKALEKDGYDVVYTDTDSIKVEIKKEDKKQ